MSDTPIPRPTPRPIYTPAIIVRNVGGTNKYAPAIIAETPMRWKTSEEKRLAYYGTIWRNTTDAAINIATNVAYLLNHEGRTASRTTPHLMIGQRLLNAGGALMGALLFGAPRTRLPAAVSGRERRATRLPTAAAYAAYAAYARDTAIISYSLQIAQKACIPLPEAPQPYERGRGRGGCIIYDIISIFF